ncbi:GNAT family N-acetyltransferase [Legionella dresdenensis]|uniref:GNAT family N-acetyltransferase n=1 Tax=Legionella dresdenensis TaxID=450200 RepID=A0ABV8CGV3_9GAMM
MIIRRLVENDLPNLIPFMKQAWQDAYPAFYNEEPKIVDAVFDVDKIRQEMSDPKNVFFGALDKGKIAGYAKLITLPESSFLDKIYVGKAIQGQGIGTQLLLVCFNHASTAGICSMKLQVEDKNHHALAFYQKHGFERMPVKRLYPSTGATLYYDYIMVCYDINNVINMLEAKYGAAQNFVATCSL